MPAVEGDDLDQIAATVIQLGDGRAGHFGRGHDELRPHVEADLSVPAAYMQVGIFKVPAGSATAVRPGPTNILLNVPSSVVLSRCHAAATVDSSLHVAV